MQGNVRDGPEVSFVPPLCGYRSAFQVYRGPGGWVEISMRGDLDCLEHLKAELSAAGGLSAWASSALAAQALIERLRGEGEGHSVDG